MTNRISNNAIFQKINNCFHLENENFCKKCGVLTIKDGVYKNNLYI